MNEDYLLLTVRNRHTEQITKIVGLFSNDELARDAADIDNLDTICKSHFIPDGQRPEELEWKNGTPGIHTAPTYTGYELIYHCQEMALDEIIGVYDEIT